MLTPAQLKARKRRLTASRVACLMRGDAEAVLRLWREMIGEEPEEDLSDVWAVQLGLCTEELNLEWYERKAGRQVSRRGEVVVHYYHNWAAATLDAWDAELNCPIECKHVGGREPLETIIERYQPQMHWQMIITGAEQCALSVIMGASEPVVEYVPRDDGYGAELMRRGAQFMRHVELLIPPVALEEAPPPIDPTKVYDFTGNNHWSVAAMDWLISRDQAKMHEESSKILKSLVPADAKKCTGHGVRITRDRAGRLSLRAE